MANARMSSLRKNMPRWVLGRAAGAHEMSFTPPRTGHQLTGQLAAKPPITARPGGDDEMEPGWDHEFRRSLRRYGCGSAS